MGLFDRTAPAPTNGKPFSLDDLLAESDEGDRVVPAPTATSTPAPIERVSVEEEEDALRLLRESRDPDAEFRRLWIEAFGHKPSAYSDGDLDRFHRERQRRSGLDVTEYVAECKRTHDASVKEAAEYQAWRKVEAEQAKQAAAARPREQAARNAANHASKMEALLAHDADEVEPPSWLIEGVVAERALTLLIGKQGHGKSTVAESIAQAVATGSDWLGRFRTRQAKVLVVQLEMSRAIDESFRDRIAAGSRVDLSEVKRGAVRSYVPMRLDDDEGFTQLSDLIAYTGAELVVIDSLSRAHDAASENDNAIMGGVMIKLERLRREDDVAILLLAHANTAGEARGASAITAACDNELRLDRANPSLESPITITRHKARQAGVERVRLRFRGGPGEPMTPELVEDKPKSKRAPMSEHARRVAATVREHGPISRNRIVRLASISQRDVGPALEAAREAGAIGQNEDELWVATASEDEES